MNKYLIADKSKLLKTKLDKLSAKLQSNLGSQGLQTEEQYLLESIKILQEFYLDLSGPTLTEQDIASIHQDDLPDPEIFNKVWTHILDDLIIIFTELENVEQLTLGNFNFITTEANRLTARLKKVSSLLGDYILYTDNPAKDAFFFKDSFNDLTRVDSQSALLNSEECEINQTEGIVTLPIDKSQDSTIRIKEAPIINPNSNGTVGNNQQLSAKYHGTIRDILDNNPDTWFEYEYVISKISEDQEPLVLDLTLNLGEEQVINFIRINPNNFGTKTVIKILSIDTSLDGIVFTSVKDDIPIGDFLTEDEENIFTLAPSTSKFAGQGLYTFTPRKAKYVNLILQQTEPYIIKTSTEDKLRYAIGLRDIELKNLKYKSKGELVSVNFNLLDEVRRVAIDTNQNPKQLSELASIKWQVSCDDGGSWREIQPQGFDGRSGEVSVPEVLEFNGASENTIQTDVPVYSLRVKASLERTDSAFEEGSSTLNKNRVNISEPYEIPTSSPFTIELTNPPIDGTVSVVDPLFGSRGKPDAAYLVKRENTSQQLFRLPFKQLPRPYKKEEVSTNYYKTILAPASEWLHVEVGGEEWTHVTSGINTYSTDWQSTSQYRLYSFNPANAELQFGNNLNTLSPQGDVHIYFDAEQLFPSELEDNHVAQLEFSTSNNKNDMLIKRYDKAESYTEVIQRNATVVHLTKQNITIYSAFNGLFTTMFGASAVEKPFINGKDELTSAYSWSIDTEEGIVYFVTPTPADSDVTVVYSYQEITELTTSEWDWADTDDLKDSVSIKESAWKTIDVVDEEVFLISGVTAFDCANLGIVKGTLSFTLTDDNNGDAQFTEADTEYPFAKEVDFVDGSTEFGQQILSNVGLYSVDYKKGKVYTTKIFQATWTLKVNYSYTDYRAEYRIFRPLDSTSYSVDLINRTVTIKDSEVLKRAQILHGGNDFYIVNYDYVSETREDVESLKESFSPMIKDYSLKIITKGNIF